MNHFIQGTEKLYEQDFGVRKYTCYSIYIHILISAIYMNDNVYYFLLDYFIGLKKCLQEYIKNDKYLLIKATNTERYSRSR